MKLAEALQERADLNKRIAQLNQRLNNNALVQEGEKPAEDPKELLKELAQDLRRLEELIGKINLTNSKTVRDGKTLTEMIARRDVLIQEINIKRSFVENSSQSFYRARNSEIKILPTTKVKDIQKDVDDLSKELRLLDNKIQELNWTIEL